MLLIIDDMTCTPRDGLRRSRARVDLDGNVLIASFATRLMMRWWAPVFLPLLAPAVFLAGRRSCQLVHGLDLDAAGATEPLVGRVDHWKLSDPLIRLAALELPWDSCSHASAQLQGIFRAEAAGVEDR